MDYELELDGKKIELPDSMVKPKVDLTDLPDAPVKKKRVRKKRQDNFDIQAAIDALPPTGGTVHVPEGTWDLGDGPIVLPNAPINVVGATTQPLQTMPPNLTDYLNIHAGGMGLGTTATPAFDQSAPLPNTFNWKEIIGGAIGMVGSAIVASMFAKK